MKLNLTLFLLITVCLGLEAALLIHQGASHHGKPIWHEMLAGHAWVGFVCGLLLVAIAKILAAMGLERQEDHD